MVEAFLITFREGIEAFLIVAIMTTFLLRLGRKDAILAIGFGIIGAIFLSIIVGLYLSALVKNPATEGFLALISGTLVVMMSFHLLRSGSKVKTLIENHVENELTKTSFMAKLGIFLFTWLMISREGMETVLFISVLSAGNESFFLMTGAFMGVLFALVVGYLWILFQHRINLTLFLQVSAVYLLLFAVQVFLYGIHELSEMNLIPLIDNYPVHIATEVFAHDGIFAQILSYSLIFIPLLWIAGYWLYKRPEGYNPAQEL